MSVYWNERTRRLLPYVPGEQPRDRKFIKLNTNENPYPPSPLVIEAVKKAAGENLRLYPDPACAELREAVAARYGLDAAEVFAGNGSDEILAFAFAAFFGGRAGEGGEPGGVTPNAGKERRVAPNGAVDGAALPFEAPLLFPDITYSFYPVYANLWNIPYKTIPLKDDFSIDVSSYLDTPGGVIFPNPNAPTGIALTLDSVRKIAGAAERNKRVFVIDEAYAAFAEKEVTALPLLKEFRNVLIIRTLSKENSLAGLRAGFALGSAELIEGLCRVRDSFNSYTLDRLALAGASAAVRDAAYYDEINRRIVATRRRFSKELLALGFRVLPSQANFVFASPPGGSKKNAKDFFQALREQGILVRHFDKPRVSDFLRISIGTDDNMNALLEACRKMLKG